jgi:hypothetical protein
LGVVLGKVIRAHLGVAEVGVAELGLATDMEVMVDIATAANAEMAANHAAAVLVALQQAVQPD